MGRRGKTPISTTKLTPLRSRDPGTGAQRGPAKEPPAKLMILKLRLDPGRSPDNHRHSPSPWPARPPQIRSPPGIAAAQLPARGPRGPARGGEALAALPRFPRGSPGVRPGRGPTRPPRATRPRRTPRVRAARWSRPSPARCGGVSLLGTYL